MSASTTTPTPKPLPRLEIPQFDCEPPLHVKARGTGDTDKDRESDVFEFICAEEWHDQIIGLSFDRSNMRHSRNDREGLVQIGAIISLACGLSSWIYPDHVLADMQEIRLLKPIYVGDKIRLTYWLRRTRPTKIVDISLEVLRDGEWLAVAKTRTVITAIFRPVRHDHVELDKSLTK